MDKYVVVPEEEFKAIQQVSRQGKGLPPQKSEYERLVALNASLQNQLKQQLSTPTPTRFPGRLQRIWDMLVESLQGLSFNKMWEIVYNGETWDGSNVFDLLKAASDETFPTPKHMPRMMALIEQARIPESMLGRRINEEIPDDLEVEENVERPARERKKTVWISRPVRKTASYDTLPFKKTRSYALRKKKSYK